MSGKTKHKFSLQQKPNKTWAILAKKQDGEQYWHGEYSLQQAAVRWGNSHLIPDRWPQAVEVEGTDWGMTSTFNSSLSSNQSPLQTINSRYDSSMLELMITAEVEFDNRKAVAEFLGLPEEMLEEIPDVKDGKSFWQIKS